MLRPGEVMQKVARDRLALASQIPVTALMVVFTFVSLWILAEPIVERRQPSAQPSTAAENMIAIPADAVLPDLDSGRLQAIGPDKFARTKLVYRLLGSPFHDGTNMPIAPLLSPHTLPYPSRIPPHAPQTHLHP